MALTLNGDTGITFPGDTTSVIPIGVGQTWQEMAASRALNTTYTNNTSKPIMLSVTLVGYNGTSRSWAYQTVSGVNFGQQYTNEYYSASNLTPGVVSFNFIVPPGLTYAITTGGAASTLSTWYELR